MITRFNDSVWFANVFGSLFLWMQFCSSMKQQKENSIEYIKQSERKEKFDMQTFLFSFVSSKQLSVLD